jgi:hypothetical protein
MHVTIRQFVPDATPVVADALNAVLMNVDRSPFVDPSVAPNAAATAPP